MTTARYLLCPGPVLSSADGQLHHVGARDLMRLYGLQKGDCLVLPTETPGRPCGLRAWALGCVDRGELIALHPRHDGNYHLPEPQPCPPPA